MALCCSQSSVSLDADAGGTFTIRWEERVLFEFALADAALEFALANAALVLDAALLSSFARARRSAILKSSMSPSS